MKNELMKNNKHKIIVFLFIVLILSFNVFAHVHNHPLNQPENPNCPAFIIQVAFSLALPTIITIASFLYLFIQAILIYHPQNFVPHYFQIYFIKRSPPGEPI